MVEEITETDRINKRLLAQGHEVGLGAGIVICIKVHPGYVIGSAGATYWYSLTGII